MPLCSDPAMYSLADVNTYTLVFLLYQSLADNNISTPI